MELRKNYIPNEDSFQKVQKKEEKMMADYDRGILKDVMRSIMENKLAVFLYCNLGSDITFGNICTIKSL